ncbi:MAG: CotS family spore coat protein [Eubacteriales bacterium]|nr:CotS family spore coat protein [Eubacteriales bacterium]
MNEKSLKVLEQYELEVISTRRGRGSYICETSQGKKLLTNCGSSEKKMIFVNRVLESMRESGYAFADIAAVNKEGNLLTPDRDDIPCILKDWYEGRECDTKNMSDIEQAVKNLAQLHKWMYLVPDEGDTRYVGENMLEELERHNRELRKVYSFVRKRKQKNEFEILFLKCYNMFYEQALEAFQMLGSTGYTQLREKAIKEGSLCHGNFNQHNIWFLGKGQVFVGNFDKCIYGVQLSDLYQFMRKIMEKQDWSEQTGRRILEVYEKENRMGESERIYLYVRLLYPEKFWKLVNQYYNHNKAWTPEKSTEKLKILIKQQEKRNTFLRGLI